jgi:hypothetical protein
MFIFFSQAESSALKHVLTREGANPEVLGSIPGATKLSV